MKLFLLAIAVTIISVQAKLSEEEKMKAIRDSTECENKSGIRDETIGRALEGDVAETEEVKIHILCFAKRQDLINEDGDLNLKKIKEDARKILGDDEVADKIVEKCAVKKDSAEETAFHLFKCFLETKNKKMK